MVVLAIVSESYGNHSIKRDTLATVVAIIRVVAAITALTKNKKIISIINKRNTGNLSICCNRNAS